MAGKTPLYLRYAQQLEAQLQAGTFPPGSRLPALREASQRGGVSLSTVIQAYQLLETKGLIEARPQSGYYVKEKRRDFRLQPEAQVERSGPTSVSIDALSLELFRDTHDPGIVHFGAATADPALLPFDKLDRIVARLAREGRFGLDASVYPEGCERLRVQIAQRAYAAGCQVKPDEIVITAGCSEAMALSLQATCKPGDLVAIESPTYFGILLQLEALGLRALEIPSNPGTGISLEALEFALDNHPVRALIETTNFANPLGSCVPDASKRRLADMLAARGVPLVENDIYGELYFGERRPTPVKAYDETGSVMLCSSFTKDIAPGYRIGWVAAGKRFDDIRRLKLALNSGTSILSQLSIADYLESGGYEIQLRKMRRAYARKVAGMSRAIERHFPEGTRFAEPEGGLVIWVRLPGGVDSVELYREALKARIAIAPGYLFSPSHKHKDYIRLNAGVWSDDSEPDLERLGRLVHGLLRT